MIAHLWFHKDLCVFLKQQSKSKQDIIKTFALPKLATFVRKGKTIANFGDAWWHCRFRQLTGLLGVVVVVDSAIFVVVVVVVVVFPVVFVIAVAVVWLVLIDFLSFLRPEVVLGSVLDRHKLALLLFPIFTRGKRN